MKIDIKKEINIKKIYIKCDRYFMCTFIMSIKVFINIILKFQMTSYDIRIVNIIVSLDVYWIKK